jgi:predicted AAA+ superfamily ATPase
LKKLTETITFYNMYLHRHIEPILQEAVTQFPVVALLGPRQVGKSTLLQTLFKDTHRYLSFDDLALRTEAKSDPVLFLKNFPGPLILDEIQYVPELLSEIKVQVDQDRYAGRFSSDRLPTVSSDERISGNFTRQDPAPSPSSHDRPGKAWNGNSTTLDKHLT